MRRGFAMVVLVSGLVGALASAPSVAQPAPGTATPKKVTYVVAAMGDSLTDPKSQGGKYLELLKTRCPKSRFDSYGKGGNMVNQMRKRFSRDVFGEGTGESRPKYTHVIVLGGIGDILSNETAKRTPKLIEADLIKMFDLAHAHGAKVIALTLPPWGGSKAYDSARDAMTQEVNAFVRAATANGQADFAVDIYPLLSCGDAKKLCGDYAFKDQLHWSAKGHEVVGQELAAKVFSDCE